MILEWIAAKTFVIATALYIEMQPLQLQNTQVAQQEHPVKVIKATKKKEKK